MAVLLAVGNVAFRHFEPRTPWWRRLLKALAVLTMTAVISYYIGRTGILIAFGIAALPVIYIHAVWLPRHGVNGWNGRATGEVLRATGMGASGSLTASQTAPTVARGAGHRTVASSRFAIDPPSRAAFTNPLGWFGISAKCPVQLASAGSRANSSPIPVNLLPRITF